VGSFDAEGVQDRHGVGDPRGQRIGGDVMWLVAAALAAVVGEDQAEVLAERLRERGGLRVLERVREAGVNENRLSATPGVVEEGADAIVRIRRVGHTQSGPSSASLRPCPSRAGEVIVVVPGMVAAPGVIE
jgi:hypothetical protein